MGRSRPHPNTTPPVARSGEAQNGQISALFEVPIGNCGKFIGPLGLALIMGAGDLIKPAAPNLVMLGPALSYFAAWYILGIIGFWVFGFEPKGRTFDEIDRKHDGLAPAVTMAARASAE